MNDIGRTSRTHGRGKSPEPAFSSTPKAQMDMPASYVTKAQSKARRLDTRCVRMKMRTPRARMVNPARLEEQDER
eukprot:CAMPEP_0170195894 /NCGR_PEP_ID=MMETSP0040_2-20121228/62503_1 /TAXON_ID=641309 /ORGANISM="Lotharella oceanica, Strain CCMP622" /LENGTH=74 /DNA_ID=CAMNT_0010445173 /DNA_START=1 /DNA_END=220 /DNA_ORIENTATION=+